MKLTMLANMLLLSIAINAQTISIDYEAWNPSNPPCNLFANETNVSATGVANVSHQTKIGQPIYNTTNKEIELATTYVSASSYLGTKFRLYYNFKANYTYKIYVTVAANVNANGNPTNPYIRVDINNYGGGGNTTCNGPQTVTPEYTGNPAAMQITDDSYSEKQFSAFVQGSNQGTLEVTAMPAANGGSKTIRLKKIRIVETPPAPVFTLSPSSVSIACGSSTTKTYTVNNVYNSAGTLSYNWNLSSANNGWLYNNSAAPQTFTTTSNSINLTSSSSASTISNVSVTVNLNGSNYSTHTSTTTVTNSLPNFSLNNYTVGLDCYSMKATASLSLGNTITWSTTNGLLINGNNSPYTTYYENVVDIYSPNGQTGVVTATIGSGVCAKQASNTLSFCPCLSWSNPNPTLIYVPNYIRSEPLIAQVDEYPDALSYQWYIDGQLIAETSTGYLWTTAWPCMSDPRNLEVVAVTSCGRSASVIVGELLLECSSYRLSVNANDNISLFPNPATNILFIKYNSIKKIKLQTKNTNNLQVSVFDNLGVLKLKKQVDNNSNAIEVNVSKLGSGIYYIELFNGKTTYRKQFIKQ